MVPSHPLRAPSRYYRDARVYGRTTTAVHGSEHPPPPFFVSLPPPSISTFISCLPLQKKRYPTRDRLTSSYIDVFFLKRGSSFLVCPEIDTTPPTATERRWHGRLRYLQPSLETNDGLGLGPGFALFFHPPKVKLPNPNPNSNPNPNPNPNPHLVPHRCKLPYKQRTQPSAPPLRTPCVSCYCFCFCFS